MKISIAMATYNGSKYIAEQLYSLANQTHLPDELIINDDCSNDQTILIAQKFAKNAPFRVETFTNEKNIGYAANFNSALEKTSGDLVFLCDQDDIWFPEKIAYMLNLAKQNPQALVIMNDAELTDAELNTKGLTKLGQILSGGLDNKSFVMGCCCLVRRELLDFCLPIPSLYKAHDNWIVDFADGLNAKVVTPKVLQYYRRHDSNESQFLANRLTKINRTQVLMQTLKYSTKKDTIAARKLQIEQMRLFVDGVNKAMLIAPEHYTLKLKNLERLSQQQLSLAEQRLIAIDKPLFSRIIAVIGILLRGSYSNARGLLSAIRDIFGHI